MTVDFNTDKYSDDLESFGSIKHKNSFCMSDRGDSEFPADSSGDSLPNVKGRLRERLPFWKDIGAGNWVTRILTLCVLADFSAHHLQPLRTFRN